MGGVVPGGFSLAKRNVYENGLVLVAAGAVQRRRAGRARPGALIFDNVRFGEILAPDMLTVVAELELGERLLLESVERYGARRRARRDDYVCDASAERMAEALARAPRRRLGRRGHRPTATRVADDEEYRVRVAITKRGGRAEVDFSGTSRQARTAINATALDAKTSVGVAFKYDPRPARAGSPRARSRPIDIVLPEGTVISALPPDGAVFAYWEQNQVILSALLRALAQARRRRRRSPATTAAPTSTTPTACSPTARRGSRRRRSAARSAPTAPTATATPTARCSPTRPTGSASRSRRSSPTRPVVVLRHELVPDSAGPGRHRGGAAMLRDSLWLHAAAAPPDVAALQARRRASASHGGRRRRDRRDLDLGRGRARTRALGTRARVLREATPIGRRARPADARPRPRRRLPLPVPPAVLGDRARARCCATSTAPAAAGATRSSATREAVKRDVRDGYVTIAGAARDYGVVITGDPDDDPEGLDARPRRDRARCGPITTK